MALANEALKDMGILFKQICWMLKVGRERKCIGKKKVIKVKVENKNIECISFRELALQKNVIIFYLFLIKTDAHADTAAKHQCLVDVEY